MALVEFKQPASRFSGRTGVAGDGQVYYTIEGRGIARTLVIPSNPRSTDQQLIRGLQTSLALQYKGLERIQADAWDLFGRKFTGKDRFGRAFTYGGIQAFLAVNTHRVLAGLAATTDPPAFATTPSPIRIVSATVNVDGDLNLALEHQVAEGAAIWRVRITPPSDSNVRLAKPGDLRYATALFSASYIASTASPQSIVLTPKFTLSAGVPIGLEVLGLTPAYVPGQALFVRHLVLG